MISSGSSSVKVEDVTSQNIKNSYVNSYVLGNYYTDGSKETKGEAQPSEAPKTNTNKGDLMYLREVYLFIKTDNAFF